MMRKSLIWGFMVLGCTVQAISISPEDHPPEYMNKDEREALKEEARDMFYHAYNAYMDNAYPADELMPLSCKGRYRNSEPDRGDIDSTLGNFSLTLVDTLDTLVVLGDLGEFENAVRLVVKDVTFDTDVIVSLFETNIRMLGGLLSGHILAEYLQSRADIMPWYRGELLNLAKDLGYRFLPAFNTTTGIPFGRINLKHGMKGVPAEMCRETCTACAGSMILEMAALSRLTGEPIFEDKAQKAMDALWKMRHRGTDLMGSVLNVHSGDWVRRDSGVGAGIDSYYEYCLKAYILLGDEKYLGRFNKHYQAVMKYVSQGPMLLDVHMHRPNTNSKNFMDALLAFWPGLQVLKGDIKPAVETHEMLYQVMQRHNFIPEAFTTDFQVHWGHHPLRPEFLESTYFLYRATGDHYYLGVGRKVLKSLQTYARVPCGYAAVSDVRTNKHDDTMDSFVLSETLKYLYLLFAEPSDLILDIDEFIFTTEGHLLPLTLAAVRSNVTSDLDRDIVQVDELGRTCPNSLHLFPASVRQPLRNMVEDVCPRRNLKRRLSAYQFQTNNLEHLKILSNMGITVLTPAAGQVRVLHTFSNARSAQDAEEGLLFMQEMVELSKKQSEQPEATPQSVTLIKKTEDWPKEITLTAGPAHFGTKLKDGKRITGAIEFAIPSEACSDLIDPESLMGKIVVMARGNCMFVEKARRIQKAGAIAGIVLDNTPGSSAAESPMFAMSGDGREPDDIKIPVVFLFTSEAAQLVALYTVNNLHAVTIGDYSTREDIQLNSPGDQSVLERLKGPFNDFLARLIKPESLGIQKVESPVMDTALSSGTNSPVVVKLSQCHLKATIFPTIGIVRIDRNDVSPAVTKATKFEEGLERAWHATKQDFVNKIYSSNDRMVIMTIARIRVEFFQLYAVRDLGIPSLEQVMVDTNLVEWFLQELCDIGPDPASMKPVDDVQSLDGKVNISDKEEGDHSARDDIQLNSPGDQSVFERLKGSFPARVIKPESLGIQREEIPVMETALLTAMNSPMPVKLSQCHLKATIFTAIGIVGIDRTGTSPAAPKTVKFEKNFEREWHAVKQDFVNKIYSSNERFVIVTLARMREKFLKLHAEIPGLEKFTAAKNVVEWFLQELCDIGPDPAFIKSVDDVENLDRKVKSSDNEEHTRNIGKSQVSENLSNENEHQKNKKSEDITSEDNVKIVDVDRIMDLWGIAEIWRVEIASKTGLEKSFAPPPTHQENVKYNVELRMNGIYYGKISSGEFPVEIGMIHLSREALKKWIESEDIESEVLEPESWSNFGEVITKLLQSGIRLKMTAGSLERQYYSVQTLRGAFTPKSIGDMINWYLMELRRFIRILKLPLTKGKMENDEKSIASETLDGRINSPDDEEIRERMKRVSEGSSSENKYDKYEKSEVKRRYLMNLKKLWLKLIENLSQNWQGDFSELMRHAGSGEKTKNIAKLFTDEFKEELREFRAFLRGEASEDGKFLLRQDRSETSAGSSDPLKSEEKNTNEFLENTPMENLDTKIYRDVIDEWKKLSTIFALEKSSDKNTEEKSKKLESDSTETKGDSEKTKEDKTNQASKHLDDEL